MHRTLEPGENCPTCARRIPYPKKDGSPVSATVSARGPIEDAANFKELREHAIVHAGLAGRKYAAFYVEYAALAKFLQSTPKNCLVDDSAAEAA